MRATEGFRICILRHRDAVKLERILDSTMEDGRRRASGKGVQQGGRVYGVAWKSDNGIQRGRE